MTLCARCPQCGRILSGDPAYPRPLRPGPAVWCHFHGRVVAHWRPLVVR